MQSFDRQAAFSGTGEVKAGLGFDLARLEEFLHARVAGFAGPVTARQFKGGQSNPTYLIETPGRRYVLRRKPPGKLLPSAHAVDREFRVLAALRPQGFPVPEPLLYCDDEGVAGTAFYLMAYVDGRVFWEPHMPTATAAERTAVYDAMNATLARLHSFDPAALGLADYGKGGNYVARQIARWTEQYRASKTETSAEMERLSLWLPRNVPPQQAVRLVHGDYRLDNLIIERSAPKVAAVIDWELSTLGDPLADFTYHLMTWDLPPFEAGAGFGTLAGCDLATLGIPGRDRYVAAYAARTGFDPRPVLDLYLAYNFFRFAAIVQGIVGRAREGTAANENAAAMERAIRPLAETAWQFARRAGAPG
jgi:aminoglycoside phosphotransferase (APT) family kinase protein